VAPRPFALAETGNVSRSILLDQIPDYADDQAAREPSEDDVDRDEPLHPPPQGRALVHLPFLLIVEVDREYRVEREEHYVERLRAALFSAVATIKGSVSRSWTASIAPALASHRKNMIETRRMGLYP